MSEKKKVVLLNLGIPFSDFLVGTPLGPLSREFMDNTKTREEGLKRATSGHQ